MPEIKEYTLRIVSTKEAENAVEAVLELVNQIKTGEILVEVFKEGNYERGETADFEIYVNDL